MGQTPDTLSTGTADKRQGGAEVARIGAEVQERFAKLPAGRHSLSTKETVALAGTVYRAFAGTLENNPGPIQRWEKILSDNALARTGDFGEGRLLIGHAARIAAAMKSRFGPIVDATRARECLVISVEDRERLLTQVARALDEAATRLERNADFDYSDDQAAARYPERQPRGGDFPQKGIKLIELFETWAKHPEQAEQAERTFNRYRSVFSALSDFLRSPYATAITSQDVRRYADAMMQEAGFKPRTIRDVHKAAISSIFNWAVGKGLVAANPADGLRIKVRASALLRPKELTDEEAKALTACCLAIAPNAPAHNPEAARRWCPMICLWTGARINEITQLRKQDVYAEGNIPFLKITPAAGSVKTGEFRDVPIHPRLIELGLLSFIAAESDGPLFVDPGVRRKVDAKTPLSERVGNQVTAWAKKECLSDPNLKKPMHAIRHRFLTVARRAGIEQQYAEALTGHAPEGEGRRYGSYEIETLAREMARLTPELVEARPKTTEKSARCNEHVK